MMASWLLIRYENYCGNWGCTSDVFAGEQWQEFARVVKGNEVIAAADVRLADEDLGHRAPAGFFHHFGAPRGVEVDPHFLDICHATRTQQLLGANAVGANCGRVHQDVRHDAHFFVPFLIGKPA
jgi:hypothetical protein